MFTPKTGSLMRVWKFGLASSFSEKMVDSGVGITVYSLTIVVLAMCNVGESVKARELMDEMVVNGKSEFREVEVILDLMKMEGVLYNVVTYTLLIEFYSLLGKIKDAQKVFDKMPVKGEMKVAEVLSSEMKSKGLDVNNVIINTLMDGYCKKGNVDDAMKLQSLMETKGFKSSVVSYNIIAAGLCKANRLDEAKTLFFTMVDRGVTPNTLTYTTLIDTFCKQGEFVEARRTFREMETKG
ncbi:putative tetratricopeptide-like helical domain superfamily [Helianthus anomalus]